MPENDNIALALLASSISTTAEEAAKSTEGHIIAQQAKDPKAALALSSLENMQIDLNCFADACDFLSSQLSDTAKVKDLIAEKGSELFWKCIRLTLEEWRSNTESSLARLKGQKSKTDWKMKLAEKLNEEFAFVKVNTEAAMQDAQMTIALVNLKAELLRDSTPERRRLDFLCKDLEWKVAKVRNRIFRSGDQKAAPGTLRPQHIIGKLATGMIAKAKTQMDAPPGYSETRPESQGPSAVEKEN